MSGELNLDTDNHGIFQETLIRDLTHALEQAKNLNMDRSTSVLHMRSLINDLQVNVDSRAEYLRRIARENERLEALSNQRGRTGARSNMESLMTSAKPATTAQDDEAQAQAVADEEAN